VVTRLGYGACVLSVVVGLVVAFGLGVPTFEEGRVVLGLVVIACSGVATALGVAGVVVLSRANGPRR